MAVTRFPHRPALDGLRGLAVVAVVAFHALGGSDPGVARGGYLGVSAFFTLSGFLITTLALVEVAERGRLDLPAFWRRRVRRLLPAAIAGVALAVVLVAAVGTPADRRAIGGDALSGLLYVANWRNVLADQSYAALFDAPGPLLHLWSLAVEEQFYVVFPLLVVAALAGGGGRRDDRVRVLRQRLGLAAAVGIVASLALPWLFDLGADRVYYGTDTRAVEICVGVLLACVAAPWVVVGDRTRPLAGRHRRQLAALSSVALVLVGGAWLTVPRDVPGLFPVGIAAHALLVATLVLAAALDVGAVAAVGRHPVLRHLGLVSYGLYLYHWPVFWLLRTTTSMGPVAVLVVGGTVALALAEASRRWLEDPVRRHRGPLQVPLRAGAATAVAAAGVAVVVSAVAPAPLIDFERAERELRLALAATSAPVPTSPEVGPAAGPAPGPAPGVAGEDQAPHPPPPPRVAFFGDSTAVLSGIGMAHAGFDDLVPVEGGARLGCGLVRAPDRRFPGGRSLPTDPGCRAWEQWWPDRLATHAPDLVILQFGPWEVMDFRRPGRSWEHLGEAGFDAYLADELLAAVDLLASTGAHVVVPTVPELRPAADQPDLCACPERVERLNALIAEVAAARPDAVTVVDLAAWLAASGRDDELRPDGVHFGLETSVPAAQGFWGPELRAVHQARGGGALRP